MRSVSSISVKTPLANESPPAAARASRAAGGRSARRGWRRRHGLRERSAREIQRRALARLHGIQVVHDDDHRPRFLLGDEVVHDYVDVTLDVPALLVLAPAVQQIENGISGLGVGVIVQAAYTRTPAATVPSLLKVPALAHLAARHVLLAVVVSAASRLGNLDRAVVEAGPKNVRVAGSATTAPSIENV